jgi:hypothetical protein
MIIMAHDVTEKNNRRSSTNLTIVPACSTIVKISMCIEFI